MNLTFETKSPRTGWHQARAVTQADRNAERLDSTEALKALQARRLCNILGCSEAAAFTLAALAYGEGRS